MRTVLVEQTQRVLLTKGLHPVPPACFTNLRSSLLCLQSQSRLKVVRPIESWGGIDHCKRACSLSFEGTVVTRKTHIPKLISASHPLQLLHLPTMRNEKRVSLLSECAQPSTRGLSPNLRSISETERLKGQKL